MKTDDMQDIATTNTERVADGWSLITDLDSLDSVLYSLNNCECGGPLHTVLDDGNMTDHDMKTSRAWLSDERCNYPKYTLTIAHAILDALELLSPAQRKLWVNDRHRVDFFDELRKLQDKTYTYQADGSYRYEDIPAASLEEAVPTKEATYTETPLGGPAMSQAQTALAEALGKSIRDTDRLFQSVRAMLSGMCIKPSEPEPTEPRYGGDYIRQQLRKVIDNPYPPYCPPLRTRVRTVGTIISIPAYQITCGKCGHEELFTQTEEQKPFNTDAVSAEWVADGWRETAEHGWACPDCTEELRSNETIKPQENREDDVQPRTPQWLQDEFKRQCAKKGCKEE